MIKATFQADLCHLQIGLFQKAFSLLDAVLVDIFYRGISDRLPEKAAEILFVQVDLACEVRYVYFVLIIVLNICERCLNALHPPVKISFRGRK